MEGEATITVYPTIYSGVIQPIFQNPIRKVIDIDGTATVEFNIEKDLGLNDEYERTVVVDVTVEELPTGRRQNNSVEVMIHKYDYQMYVIKTADYFKPGLPYVAYVSTNALQINFVHYNSKYLILLFLLSMMFFYNTIPLICRYKYQITMALQ